MLSNLLYLLKRVFLLSDDLISIYLLLDRHCIGRNLFGLNTWCLNCYLYLIHCIRINLNIYFFSILLILLHYTRINLNIYFFNILLILLIKQWLLVLLFLFISLHFYFFCFSKFLLERIHRNCSPRYKSILNVSCIVVLKVLEGNVLIC